VQTPKIPALAGGRIPQLERPQRTRLLHLKVGACRINDMVKAQKLRGIMKNSEKTTYAKSYHSHLPRVAGGTFFPAEDPPGPLVMVSGCWRFWWRGWGLWPRFRRWWWWR
jgi:hypothetical protein